MKCIFSFLLFAFASLTALAQVDTAQQVAAGRANSPEQQNKPYVILISADGFRYDYAEKYNAVHLLALANEGVKASSMAPSFPSVTFPNHYTIVTGLYPSHHGLIENNFYDRNLKRFYSYKGKTASEGVWYGGTPLWVLAEQQKMITASYFWVGSEAAIQNIYPSYYYTFNQVTSIDKRIAAVVDC